MRWWYHVFIILIFPSPLAKETVKIQTEDEDLKLCYIRNKTIFLLAFLHWTFWTHFIHYQSSIYFHFFMVKFIKTDWAEVINLNKKPQHVPVFWGVKIWHVLTERQTKRKNTGSWGQWFPSLTDFPAEIIPGRCSMPFNGHHIHVQETSVQGHLQLTCSSGNPSLCWW